MRDFINIGSTPFGEDCIQVGNSDYQGAMKAECRRFLELIEKVCGPPPEGASLAVKGFSHDFGSYYEVVCYFDDENQEAAEYAYWVESNAPEFWTDEEGSALFQ